MIAIVNVNEAWGIGKDGGLLTYIPEDMRFFRETTRGKVVVMGRRTLLSFPKHAPLKGRVNVVLTKDASRIPPESYEAIAAERRKAAEETMRETGATGSAPAGRCEGCEESGAVESSSDGDAALRNARPTELLHAGDIASLLQLLEHYPKDEIYVIGGETVYRALLPYCDTCLVTKNDEKAEADTYFPDLDRDAAWEIAERSAERTYEGIRYAFYTYRRVEKTPPARTEKLH